MVIIDAHCHLSSRMGGGDATDLIKAMDIAGIDKSIVFGVGDNTLVEESTQKYTDRFYPFYYFDPKYEEIQLPELETYAKKGWKGVKVGHEYSAAPAMYQMMEVAEKYDMIYVHHSGGGNKYNPYMIGDLASSFPKVKTVILHMGGGMSLDVELVSTKVAEKNPNIYLETCYAHPYAIKQAVDRLGADRVLFGSDASNAGYADHYEKPGEYQKIHLDAVRLIGLPKEQEDMVLGGAAAKILGVDA
jgi:predicted TIM-barrel fold metal-dependent hydrolase